MARQLSTSQQRLIFSAILVIWSGGLVARAEPGENEIPPTPAADRKLDPMELHKVLAYADFLIDPTNEESERFSKADFFGRNVRHRYCIPSLLAVMRNRDESHRLRQICLFSLSAINDDRVVDFLIDAIPEKVLGQQANEQLMKVTAVSVGIINPMEPDPDGTFRRELQERWRRWWKINRCKTKLRSNSAFNSVAAFYTEIKVDED